MWIFTLLATVRFWKTDNAAGWLMLPYLLWTTFAGYLNMGIYLPGDFSNPVFQAAIDRIIKACHEAGKKCIFFTGTVDGIAAGFARGFDGMAYSLDAAIFIEALRERVEKARQLS